MDVPHREKYIEFHVTGVKRLRTVFNKHLMHLGDTALH